MINYHCTVSAYRIKVHKSIRIPEFHSRTCKQVNSAIDIASITYEFAIKYIGVLISIYSGILSQGKSSGSIFGKVNASEYKFIYIPGESNIIVILNDNINIVSIGIHIVRYVSFARYHKTAAVLKEVYVSITKVIFIVYYKLCWRYAYIADAYVSEEQSVIASHIGICCNFHYRTGTYRRAYVIGCNTKQIWLICKPKHRSIKAYIVRNAYC